MESKSSSEPPSFGALLRRHRAAAGISQEALAERAGLSRRGIADLERGARRLPYAETIRRLADALRLGGHDRTEFLAAVGRAKRATTAEVVRPMHLPAPLSSFIGRQEQIAEVRGRLATSRLVTLVGTGGIGKTRLAREVVRDLDDAGQEIAWVDLAPLRSPELVPQTVATSLGVRERQGQAMLETLVETLGLRSPVLLVIDNYEHVLQACVELVDALLRGCSALRVLGTSREPLHLMGEVIWRVPALQVPETGAQELREILDTEAVGLFVERAQAADRTFAATGRNAPVISELCRRLDGIPLAIELAAARVNVLSVEQIAGRLDQQFRLLTQAGSTAPARHHTLRATMEWSFELLSEPEQRVFERLGVFAGGCTLEAAEAVCSGQRVAPEQVLDLLTRIVDKSLVVADRTAEGPVRYRMLETLRQFARERLAASDAARSITRAHGEYYVVLAERAEPELTAEQLGVWMQRLEQEHDNLRAVLQWSLDAGEVELGLRLAGAVRAFWSVYGHLSEGRRWLEWLLALPGSGGALAGTRAKALFVAGSLAKQQGDYVRAAALLEESLALSREVGDSRWSAWSLIGLGDVALEQTDYRRAAALLHEARALAGAVGDKFAIWTTVELSGLLAMHQGDYRRAAALADEGLALAQELGGLGIAWSLLLLGSIARDQGDRGRAAALWEESLALARAFYNKLLIAETLADLGVVARDQGDHSRAATRLEEALQLARDLGSGLHISQSLTSLGGVSADQGDYRRAAVLLEESLGLARKRGDMRGVAMATEELAAVAWAQAQPERAARLFGAARGVREAIGAPLPPADRARYDHFQP